MKNHKKLKEICDKIWYKVNYKFEFNDWYFTESYNEYDSCYMEREVNVREIIFTQDFIDKFKNCTLIEDYYLADLILEHLDDPVSYLYKLII